MKIYLITLWIGLLLVSEISFYIVYKLMVTPHLSINTEIDEAYAGIAMIFEMGYIIMLSLSAGSIFLNICHSFRKYPILRFLSFFLLPTIVSTILFSPPGLTKKEYITHILPLAAVFFTCLLIAYLLFTRYLKNINDVSKDLP